MIAAQLSGASTLTSFGTIAPRTPLTASGGLPQSSVKSFIVSALSRYANPAATTTRACPPSKSIVPSRFTKLLALTSSGDGAPASLGVVSAGVSGAVVSGAGTAGVSLGGGI